MWVLGHYPVKTPEENFTFTLIFMKEQERY